jgi:flagellar biogenesis protein FliO
MDLAYQMMAVMGVLAALFVTVRLLARRSLLPARKASPVLSIEARLPLTAQHQLHLVNWQGRPLLVATFPGGCSTLADPTALSSAASAPPPVPGTPVAQMGVGA